MSGRQSPWFAFGMRVKRRLTSYLDVSVAHMMFVSLQRQVSMFFADKTNEGLAVPPPLSVKAQCSPSSAPHQANIRSDVFSHASSGFLCIESNTLTWQYLVRWRSGQCPGLTTAMATLWLWLLCCHRLSPFYCCKQTFKVKCLCFMSGLKET